MTKRGAPALFLLKVLRTVTAPWRTSPRYGSVSVGWWSAATVAMLWLSLAERDWCGTARTPKRTVWLGSSG